ncbi:MAG: metal ABC transporter permease, partial [Actinobacteria bacterium]
LVAVVVDEEGARVAGLPVAALNALTAALAAVTIALSMRVVGILLIAALMVLPVIAASRIAWSMRATMLIAMGIGLASVLTGITVAYYADLPPGGTTVLVSAAAVLLAELASAPAHLLDRRVPTEQVAGRQPSTRSSSPTPALRFRCC